VNDVHVTVQGNLGGPVRHHETAGGPVASFRLGCTPSWFDRRTQQWVEGETQWYSVSAWRALATHCSTSLSPGDPVVVHGRLTMRTYEDADGKPRTDLELTARTVGHDLARGTSTFARAARAEPGEATAAA